MIDNYCRNRFADAEVNKVLLSLLDVLLIKDHSLRHMLSLVQDPAEKEYNLRRSQAYITFLNSMLDEGDWIQDRFT
jgi:hypothetical protein